MILRFYWFNLRLTTQRCGVTELLLVREMERNDNKRRETVVCDFFIDNQIFESDILA